MPSSTSSSNADGRMTARNPLTVVGVALLLAIVVLACWEVWLRVQGAEPHLRVTEERWALARDRLESDSSPNAVALLGASRTRSGISHQMLHDELGATAVHNLAIAGEGPYAAFIDIARKSQFRGLVVLQILPPWIAPGFGRDNQQPFVDFYRKNWGPFIKLETVLSDAVERQVAFTFERYSLHFQDDPVLAALPSPDGSHVDMKDKPAQTARIIAKIKQEGLMPR